MSRSRQMCPVCAFVTSSHITRVVRFCVWAKACVPVAPSPSCGERNPCCGGCQGNSVQVLARCDEHADGPDGPPAILWELIISGVRCRPWCHPHGGNFRFGDGGQRVLATGGAKEELPPGVFRERDGLIYKFNVDGRRSMADRPKIDRKSTPNRYNIGWAHVGGRPF